ncbi:hypothetical protein AVEN_225762-1 [Araneus ventricosus]|uniref:DDE-1 domain-containing protein n=1 Tax=Araneus ventricosus TaxID=182803 RepID=A0A4Y2N9K5_ARAVE|nr:hypothetical protein AVEN_225762-1 [Araneus ventricosus]
MENVWPDIIRNYDEKDIFNADETGLFYKLTPNQTLKFQGENCVGGKLSKVRITILVCANMNGSEKQKLTVIGKSQKPSISSTPNRIKGRGGLVAGSRFQVRNPIPLKIHRVWGPLHAKSYVVAKRPPVGVTWKFGEGVPTQVSSKTSDRGSKLRVPSQNRPRVASKREVNITKLNQNE